MSEKIPIIDLFAGPGGLGEGFSAFSLKSGESPFKIALSIEKDAQAHKTLTLRAFFRQFLPENVPDEYYAYLRNTDEPERVRRAQLFGAYPNEAKRAHAEALLEELGSDTTEVVRKQIINALGSRRREFVLLGGPPCQAYSIIGRSRNKGVKDYEPTKDKRQTLYVEYLQVLADHRPAVFVMENVKGLLSASLRNNSIFESIVEDLHSPCDALQREGRDFISGRRNCLYDLFPLVEFDDGKTEDLRRFIIKMERYGIPQARHRLIVLGVRRDLAIKKVPTLVPKPCVPVSRVTSDLPPLRSGLSQGGDSIERWKEEVLSLRTRSCVKHPVDEQVGKAIITALTGLSKRTLTRGAEFVDSPPQPAYRPDWYFDKRIRGVCNHTTRAHIGEDLHRYLFAACFAQVRERSPGLRDFPTELLPKHKNAERAVVDGTFGDRFHVQHAERPSTTVTCHLAKDGHYFIHPDASQCRSMTVREVARLQTFPDNYFFCGPRTAQYIQVGNAVPPLLANQIADVVHQILKEAGLV